MRPIGGYFELELQRIGNIPHADGVFVNSGKNALLYILLALKPKKVYIPYFTCSSVLDPFMKLNISYEFYHINENLELSELINLSEGEYLLANNYFGIKDQYILILAKIYGSHLIVDNAQALFAPETQNCFYSTRKFVGVPDGGIALTDKYLAYEFKTDLSYSRCSHHLKRYDCGASAGYIDFKANEKALEEHTILKTSALTMALLNNIDFNSVKQKRITNFNILHEALESFNQLKFSLSTTSVPMVYPYLCKNENLRKELISEQVFVATYWPNVLEWCRKEDIEYQFCNEIIPVPIDQRYGMPEMKYIIDIIKRNNNIF